MLLEVRDVSVAFGGLRAVNAATLSAEASHITGLIGPNGAGKTTLFNVVTGLQTPTAGTVRLEGRDITGLKPHQRAHAGIARTFQKLEVFATLTSMENVLVAAERASAGRSTAHARASALIDRLGLSDVVDEPVGSLPTGRARLVELARALATEPTLLLLDEPSSGLNEEETDRMGDLLNEIVSTGPGVLIVEHDMRLVMRVCDHIHVLDFGEVICSGLPQEVRADPSVQSAYLGAAADIEGAST